MNEPSEKTAPILIQVEGEDEHGGALSLITRGELIVKPGAFSLHFSAVNAEDREIVHTAIDCEGDTVTIWRSAGGLAMIVCREQATFLGEYHTPLGCFKMRVFATEVRATRRGRSGRIRLTYQMAMYAAAAPSGETVLHRLDLRFRPCSA
ncbi:MAG: DUF1934 domain-containing protein [Oscillospiraceae bacterium]|jgi:uncharacterized beta-barrel protein YwiB (DUF1934 family)|nr:DUF1934 domain-containing protein [Oscillospiraceae bacterium]